MQGPYYPPGAHQFSLYQPDILHAIRNYKRIECFDEIANLLSGFIYVIDIPSRSAVYITHNGLDFVGYQLENARRMGINFFYQVIHPDDQGVIETVFNYFESTSEKFAFGDMARVKHVNENWHWMYFTFQEFTKQENGQTDYIIGICHDTSDIFHPGTNPIQKYLHQMDFIRKNADKFNQLTPREKEILKLIALEYTNQEIAEEIYISKLTVDTHRKNIIKKLNVNSTVGLIRFAYSFGLA